PLDLTFRDEQDKPVTLRQYFGEKPVILVLAYYRCPRLCSLVLNGLVSGLREIDYEIGNQFIVVTVSIDPREAPELAAAKKAAYAERYGRAGAASGWHFLTGEEAAIQRLADAVGYRYAYDAERDQFAHDSAIMVLTPDGTIARYFYGIEFPARELRFGLEDASAGKVGSPVTRPLRLLCFAYDPSTGKYTLMTLRLAPARYVFGLGGSRLDHRASGDCAHHLFLEFTRLFQLGQAARRFHRGLRRRPAVDVEDAAPGRPARDQHAARPRQSAGQVDD